MGAIHPLSEGQPVAESLEVGGVVVDSEDREGGQASLGGESASRGVGVEQVFVDQGVTDEPSEALQPGVHLHSLDNLWQKVSRHQENRYRLGISHCVQEWQLLSMDECNFLNMILTCSCA